MANGKTKNFFVWIIMGLLFVGLMGFGATGLSGNISSIGSVGEKPVSVQRYYQELQSQISIASAQAGRALSFPEAEAANLPARALQTVVAERSLDSEAAMLGLSVGDDVVGEQVLANPSFRGIDGAFDRTVYREALARSNTNVREYETDLRDGASRALLQGAVFTGVSDPVAFGEVVAKFTREGRTFTWAPLTSDNVEITLPEPTDADLQAHYDANPELYTSLETRVLRYVWLTPDMIQDDMPVDENELRAEYEERIDEFVQAERRLIERLVFSSEEDAQTALDAINAGETTFPDLVEERGLSLSDVDGGDVTEAEMGDAGAAIFASETGGVSGPFPSDLGPTLFRMNAVLAARNTTFEEALPQLREDQSAARARRVIEDQIDPITNLMAGGATLDNLVEQTDMVLGELDFTSVTTDGIAAYAAFRELAVTQNVGDYPELAELDDGGLFALEVVEIHEPDLIPLDDIREDVVAGWEVQETTAAVIAAAEDKQAQLSSAVQDFAFLDLDSVQETNITRRGFINGAPSTFLTEIFEMEQGDVRVIPNEGNAIIVRLDAITAADETDEAYTAEVASVAETVGEGIAQDIYELYNRTVQLRTDVQINEQALNAVHTNFR
ncbi:peptidyl-prolyl cis-trans isomerase D [Octadecabacter temperatus]|uniref:Parvulin-like PPIase n=1 Tax=Octadecabacter temperatus TaxID=1458307 RepID=A0A0K0Y5F4_9RHOB|nr:peptidylprolyl isomerase [Octadecabacter temperatus]AKS46199.1 Peptidyl-prolyl cis-trans isomerase D [Octadecabacter temperatus]SIO09506.1 peptidyl-prolyl cis-trans isomerase D [Octadecabacter temperatus]